MRLEDFPNTPSINDYQMLKLEEECISTAIGRAEMTVSPFTILALIARIKGIHRGTPHPPV